MNEDSKQHMYQKKKSILMFICAGMPLHNITSYCIFVNQFLYFVLLSYYILVPTILLGFVEDMFDNVHASILK